jgi:hypothetical protein
MPLPACGPESVEVQVMRFRPAVVRRTTVEPRAKTTRANIPQPQGVIEPEGAREASDDQLKVIEHQESNVNVAGI